MATSIYAPTREFTPATPADGIGGGLIGTLLGYAATQLGAANGMPMLGLTGQPIASRYEQMRLAQMQQELVSRVAGSNSDRNAVGSLVGHAAETFIGRGSWSSSAQNQFNQFYGRYGAPALAFMSQQFPDMTDALLGPGGGNTVAAQHMSRAMMSQRDPVTGQRGVGPATGAEFVDRFMSRLHDTPGMHPGLSRAQTGLLYSTMSRSGMIANDPLAAAGLKPGDLNTPESVEKFKNTNFESAANKVKEWGRVIKGLRQIVGEVAANSDAFSAIDTLTGSLGTSMSANNVGRHLRLLGNAAEGAGWGKEQLATISMQNQQTALQMGMTSGMGELATMTQGTAQTAFRNAGMDARGRGVWGASSAETATQLAGDAALRGSASMLGNRLGFLGRLQKYQPGLKMEGALGAYRDAAMSGQGTFTYTDPKTGRSVTRNVGDVNDSELISMISAANPNIRTENLREQLQQRRANEEGLALNPETSQTIVQAQRVTHENRMRNFASNRLKSGSRLLDEKLAAVGTEAVFGATWEQRTADGGVGEQRLYVAAVRKKLEETVRTGSKEERKAAQAMLARGDADIAASWENAKGALDDALRRNSNNPNDTLAARNAQYARGNVAEQDRVRKENEAKRKDAELTAGSDREETSPLARMTGYLRRKKPGTATATGLMAVSLGADAGAVDTIEQTGDLIKRGWKFLEDTFSKSSDKPDTKDSAAATKQGPVKYEIAKLEVNQPGSPVAAVLTLGGMDAVG